MIDTGIYLPLRIFRGRDLAELSINRRECAGYTFDNVAIFNYPLQYIPPFQRTTGGRASALEREVDIFLNDVCTGDRYDLADRGGIRGLGENYAIDSVKVRETDAANTRYDTWFGGLTDVEFPAGTYYLTFEDSLGVAYYSEIFNSVDVSNMTEIRYRNTEGMMDDIYWRPGFYAFAWVDSVIDKPTYPITEETREDQEGDIHRTFQRWEKRHSISTMGVESVADALSLLPMMEEVYINDTRVYDVVVDISWEEEYECLSKIGISFMRKKILKTF